ncbi:MAG: phage portal protein [Tissierellia bacterium]|nr:phage portal protein [Tissierellia bacterium]
MEKRSLFTKIFGNKKDVQSMKRFELLTSSNNTFYSWNGKLFENDIVRSAIRPKANAIGKLTAKHIKESGDNIIKINPDPYIKAILEQPNPYMSIQDFLTKMTFQRELNHNAFAYIKRDDFGNPIEIYPIPYSSIELLEYGEELFLRFQFWTGKFITVPYVDLIHLRKDFANDSDFFGDKGTLAIKGVMEVITTTDQGIVAAVKNSAVIKWIMKFKQTLKPDDVKLQLKEFTDNYLSITNTGGATFSDPRYELEQVKDNSYVPNAAQMDRSVQRLYSYCGVNDAIVQGKWTEDQFNAWFEAEIEPIIIQLSNAFTRAFFSRQKRAMGNKIVFEASNLAFANMSTKLALVAMVDRGAMTPNEWRKVLNLGPIEGGDKPLLRLDTARLGENKPDKINKPVEGDDDANKDDK